MRQALLKTPCPFPTCPNPSCSGKTLVRNGVRTCKRYPPAQRWKCTTCLRSFLDTPSAHPASNAEEQALVIRLHNEGLSLRGIARSLNRSLNFVQMVIKKSQSR